MWRIKFAYDDRIHLLQHLQTFSSISIHSSSTLLNDNQRSSAQLTYSLLNRKDWIDIRAESNLITVTDLGKELPKESVSLSGPEKHVFTEGPAWSGEDLFLSVMNSSSDAMGQIQLDVDLTFDMGASHENLLVMIGKTEDATAKSTWQHFWTGQVVFQKEKSNFLLSLSGKVDKVTLSKWEKSENISLNVIWIATFNRQFKHLIDVRPLEETSRGDSYTSAHRYTHMGFIYDGSLEPRWKRFKINCTAPYAFISYRQNLRLTSASERKDYSSLRGTWVEARQLCLKFDALLPILRSKEELDNLISIFKLPYQSPPPMPVMFIGLIKTKVNMLENTLLVSQPSRFARQLRQKVVSAQADSKTSESLYEKHPHNKWSINLHFYCFCK